MVRVSLTSAELLEGTDYVFDILHRMPVRHHDSITRFHDDQIINSSRRH